MSARDGQSARHRQPGGVVHTYLGYDPIKFPLPDGEAGDVVSPAFDHMMLYGSLDELTPEQLADAVQLDPEQITGLGPSLAALIAMLEERKRRILETYETCTARREAEASYQAAGSAIEVPEARRRAYENAIRRKQLVDLERMWYRSDQSGSFAQELVGLMQHLHNHYEVEQLAARYPFSGKESLSIDDAISIKEDLETIDKLLEQLREAARNAKVYLIDMDSLARFAESQQIDELSAIQRQVADIIEQLAEQQGLRRGPDGYKLTPRAMKLFQSKLLDHIFSDLQASRTGRHDVQVAGEGAVELQRTKSYEFGDSLANMDVTGTLINAMVRSGEGLPIRIKPEDIDVHLTRNTPKCATVVCMDMSGSMRWGGQYVNVKRMAMALHGLIRTEYPGDFLDFIEVCTLPRRRTIAEIPELMPRPVTIHDPVVRLKADMGSGKLTEFDLPPHFTNIQHGLQLARRLLQVQDTPNRQVILITDGLPTAHFEDRWLYLLYPPDRRTEHFTMREGLLCRDEGIVLNLFLLSSWNQSEEDVRFAHRLTERTGGRVFFVGGRDLDRYVVWDYLKRRRYTVG